MLTKLHEPIPVFWVHGLTSSHSTRERVPASAQTSASATFTSGNCDRDQKFLSQSMDDLPGRWKCQGYGVTNGLKLPWPASACNVLLQPPLPPAQGFVCLRSRSALILHSPHLGSIQHLNNLIQSLREGQPSGPVITPHISCHGVCWGPAS